MTVFAERRRSTKRCGSCLAPRKAYPDQDQVPVHLHAGRNELLVKVVQLGAGWGLYVRLMTKDKDVKPTLDIGER